MGGRPYTQDERNNFLQQVIEGLEQGVPLAVTCREINVSSDAIYDWEAADESIKRRIARARKLGHDTIAWRARKVAAGEENVSSGDVQRDRLMIETDLKLLAKWSPRDYGDKVALTGDDGGPIKHQHLIDPGKLSEAALREIAALGSPDAS